MGGRQGWVTGCIRLGRYRSQSDILTQVELIEEEIVKALCLQAMLGEGGLGKVAQVVRDDDISSSGDCCGKYMVIVRVR